MTLADFEVMETEFKQMFDHRRARNVTAAMYGRGVNIMTPNWLGYLIADDGPVEITWGRGFANELIFGCTWPMTCPDHRDRSRMVHTLEEVERVIDDVPVEGEDDGESPDD